MFATFFVRSDIYLSALSFEFLLSQNLLGFGCCFAREYIFFHFCLKQKSIYTQRRQLSIISNLIGAEDIARTMQIIQLS